MAEIVAAVAWVLVGPWEWLDASHLYAAAAGLIVGVAIGLGISAALASFAYKRFLRALQPAQVQRQPYTPPQLGPVGCNRDIAPLDIRKTSGLPPPLPSLMLVSICRKHYALSKSIPSPRPIRMTRFLVNRLRHLIYLYGFTRHSHSRTQARPYPARCTTSLYHQPMHPHALPNLPIDGCHQSHLQLYLPTAAVCSVNRHA